jgi:DNA-directed RNA polymerase subunit M/transcription elongation factor TFIIS
MDNDYSFLSRNKISMSVKKLLNLAGFTEEEIRIVKKYFDEDNTDLIYEFTIYKDEYGFDEALSHLDSNRKLSSFVFNDPFYDKSREREKEEIDILQMRKKGVKGIAICPFCKGETVSYSTVQDRGADEATSVIFTCDSCHKNFR